MNLSIAASLLLLCPSGVSAIFPAPLQLWKEDECIDGRNEDLRGEAAHPPSLKVEELVLTEEECLHLIDATAEEEFDNGTVSNYRSFIKIDVAEDFYQKLRDPSLARDGKLEVPISRVLQTTTPHRDGYYGSAHLGVQDGALVDEEVTLLFLNDNPGSNFVYGEEKIPVKCGTKVTFNGGYTHNTEVLAGGTVKFLGPLTVASGLKSGFFGGQCGTATGGYCSCPACDSANGLSGAEFTQSCCNAVAVPTPGKCGYADNWIVAGTCTAANSKSGKADKSTKKTKSPKASKNT